ncbi:MAG: hypothetical protein EKK52_02610 [Burkholderiales bacterium]|nr:MAG: hypothetical protein EKK52_02610 [Burkholderiales bacterium]
MVSSLHKAAALNTLHAQGRVGTPSSGGSAAKSTSASSTSASTATKTAAARQHPAGELSATALQRAAGMAKNAAAAQGLERGQKTLAADLRTALGKAGVKLGAAVEFSVSSSGAVEVRGSEADKAAVQRFLKSDTRQPSFASRIATQAQDALKLSSTIQQSAAISQAAQLSKTSGGVVSLYSSLMQSAGTAHVVFSVSAASSSLSFPGSLATKA